MRQDPGTPPPHPSSSAASPLRLDELVTRIAVAFMPVSASTLQVTLEKTLQELTAFFGVDTSFLRHNSFERDATVLVAEWPIRENVPDPDPLGEVPFGVDPVFDATRDLREPFFMRPAVGSDAYQERVEQGSGVSGVSMAMVPLIRASATVGVLGFVKFGDRAWDVDESNALQAVASLMVQLQARVDAEERLLFHAYHDELTGLPNRRALLEELDGRLGATTAAPTALLYLDLDRFKSVNDSLGHAAGDGLLVAVTERLLAVTGGSDFVARLAGDEFIVVLDEPGSAEALEQRAAALLAAVAQPVELAGHHITRDASLGIAVAGPGETTVDDLLAAADAALHVAKDHGGNRFVVFDDDLRLAAKERSHTEVLLRDALHDGGLLLHYQPEVDLRTGQLLAVEALVRWDHPEKGLTTAGSFIEVAEATGLIVDIGSWVMREACRQMAAWRKRHPDLRITMRVNMSPAQLATGNLVEIVRAALHDNGLPGRVVCLEITEHAVMQDIEQAIQTLHELKLLGVSLAIDDFGIGFSSMSQLKRLPVDILKIDQAFVSGLGVDGGDRAIVDATIRLASAFGLDVIAEGVDRPSLVHELLELGCRRAQGFLLCRPAPPAALEALLVSGGFDPADFTRPAGAAARGSSTPSPKSLAHALR